MKLIYIDTETTGTDPEKHALVQIAGIIEIDGVLKEEFNFCARPNDDDQISIGAIEATGMDLLKVIHYQDQSDMLVQIVKTFDTYIQKYKKNKTVGDRFIPVGYNVEFDMGFLKALFRKYHHKYFYAYISPQTVDVYHMAKYLAAFGLIKPKSFTLGDVCASMGIEFNPHDALEDIQATRKLAYEFNRCFMSMTLQPAQGELFGNEDQSVMDKDLGLGELVKVVAGPHQGSYGAYVEGDMERDPRRYGIQDKDSKEVKWCIRDELMRGSAEECL